VCRPRKRRRVSWLETFGPKCRVCRREGMKLFPQGRALSHREVRDRAPLRIRRVRTAAAASSRASTCPAAREAEGAPVLRLAREAVSATTTRKASRRSGVTGEELLRCSRRGSTTSSTASASLPRARRRVSSCATATFHVNGRREHSRAYQVRPDEIITVARNSSAAAGDPRRTDLVSTVAPWLQGRPPTASPARC